MKRRRRIRIGKIIGFTLVFALLVLVVAYLEGGDPFRLLNIIGAVGLAYVVSLMLFGEGRDDPPPPKKLLIRVCKDGTELAEEINELRYPHYYIEGKLTHAPEVAKEPLRYWVPSDIRIVRLCNVAPHGWVLREEEESGYPTGRAWIDEVEPFTNEVRVVREN